ncbi:MAG: hypothetical protein O7F72_01300 [Proteobacteria bacterium]|nr:hypothetical protein [Pseudomonadota bacterium]
MKKIIKAMLAAVVTASIFAFAGSAIADKPVCTDADGNEIACERGPHNDSESADGTGGTESADGTGGTESADGTGTESADGTGIESADGTGGTESADGTGGTESADDPEGT